MFLSIYSNYVKAVTFIQKNLYVILPYLMFVAFGRTVREWSLGGGVNRAVYPVGVSLIICFTEVVVIASVYAKEAIIDPSHSIWQTLKKFYDKAVLLFAACFGILVFFQVLLTLLNVDLNSILGFVFSVLVFYGFFALGLRHSMFYNEYLGIRSGMTGIKHLYNHFPFYFSYAFTGVMVVVISDFLLPSLINWIAVLVSPVLYSLISIALTYAFIDKNKKEKNVS